VVGDAAQDVQFGHVSRRAAARDVVADGAVAVDGSRGAVPAEAGDIDQVEFVKASVAHVVGVHEHHGAQARQAAVAVVVGVDRGVELVVRADRGQRQPSLAGIDVVRKRREPELGASGGRQESAFAGGLAEAEAVRAADARVEILETVKYPSHRVADPVVVVGG
jgi:hypothetical protein